MNKSKSLYQFTFRLTSSHPNVTNVKTRETFWGFFFEHFLATSQENHISQDLLESRLKQRCGRELRERLIRESRIERTETSESFDDDRLSRRRYDSYTNSYSPYVHNIFFMVEDIAYSSMTMTFAIAGLTSLVKLFNNDLTGFETFLNLYIIDAFIACFPYGVLKNKNSHFNLKDEIGQYFNWEIEISEEVKKAFKIVDKDKNEKEYKTLRRLAINPTL